MTAIRLGIYLVEYNVKAQCDPMKLVMSKGVLEPPHVIGPLGITLPVGHYKHPILPLVFGKLG